MQFENRTPELQMFSIESSIENLMKEYEMAVRNKEFERAQKIVEEINNLDKQKIDINNKIINMKKGGEASFPDLTGDGKVTQADILKGRGVYAEGGETIDDELAGMQMSEEDAMAEIQSIAPQTKMIEQLVMAVMQMVQQGISEQEIINFLKEQGLDDEDIEDLFTMVMQQMQQGQQDPIASELQEMQ